MNYQDITKYLLQIPKFCKKTTKENLGNILEKLGNPQEQVKYIHVAGTNGKGSVCAFLNTILLGAGKRTGLFTSPHLVRINERIRIDGEEISDEAFVQTFEKVMEKVKEVESEGGVHPSFFEFLFLMAAVAFRDAGVEFAIFEVGLGGRLDSTNILQKPLVSVITSIGLDHTEILGDTIEEIAAEKGGIMKAGVPVVFYWQEKSGEVLKEIAEQKKTRWYALQKKDIKINEISSKQVDFSLNNRYYKCDSVKVSFPAPYQAVNASLALLAFAILSEEIQEFQEFPHPEQYLWKTRWEGRMEQVRPGVFLDGAHNKAGIEAFLTSVDSIPCEGRRSLLFSVVGDKDYTHMIEELLKHKMWDRVYLSGIQNSRAESAEELAGIFKKNGMEQIEVFSEAGQALEHALQDKKEEDLLFCTGSLYLIGELKEYLEVIE